jgi:hypothetical protein
MLPHGPGLSLHDHPGQRHSCQALNVALSNLTTCMTCFWAQDTAAPVACAQLTGDTSDPYVVASVGDSCRVTPVVWGDTHPVWQVTLPLYIR